MLFETEGFDVGFHRIADDLGIGVGTVYRHFADHDALIVGLYERYQQRVDELGHEVMTSPEGMPRIEHFIDATVAFSMRRPVARRVAAHVQRRHPELVSTTPRWIDELTASVQAAQATGDLRPDATVIDIAVLAGMLADLATIEEPRRSIVLPRMRSYVLDALRRQGAARPPLPTATLTPPDLPHLTHQPGRA